MSCWKDGTLPASIHSEYPEDPFTSLFNFITPCKNITNRMAQNFAAKQVEAVLGHGDQDRATHTDISNPDREGGSYADESGEKMKALVWMGKNDVRVGP